MSASYGRSRFDYDDDDPHEDADSVATTPSDRFRSQLREKVHRALSTLFPEHNRDALGDWNPREILELTAICELARVYRLAETQKPLLTRNTILMILDKLTTGASFRDIAKNSLIEMEQHLRLLAAALRLYKYEGATLLHSLRDSLYKGINDLKDNFDDDRKNCPPELLIESENVAFLLQHCLYLLISIEDSESLTATAAKRVFALSDAALSVYGSQYVDARKHIREATKAQRTRPKWHDEFMKLEDTCFTIFARGIALESETSQEITEIYSEEREAVIDLRNHLEDLLNVEPGRLYALSDGWRRIRGRTTNIAMAMGTYEEHAEYFQYGLLDLFYQLLFRIRGRGLCFPEIVGVIKAVLERTHKKADRLHRKAIDIYRRINRLGADDEKDYGELEDCEYIDNWTSHHSHNIESVQFAEERSKRTAEDAAKIRNTEKKLLKNGLSLFGRGLISDYQMRRRPVAPSMTIQSNIFPSIPEQDPRRASVASSSAAAIPLADAHFVQEPLRSSPEPILPTRNDIRDSRQSAVDDDSIAIIAEFFRRNEGVDIERKLREYYQRTLSINSAGSSFPHVSPLIRGSDSDNTARPRESSIQSVPGTEANGLNDPWVHLEQLSPTVSSNRQSDQIRTDLIDLSDESSEPANPAPTPQPINSAASIFSQRTANSTTTSRLHTSLTTTNPISRIVSAKPSRKYSGTSSSYSELATKTTQTNLLSQGQKSKPRTKDKVDFTSISSSGSTLVIVAKYSFWIWKTDPVSLSCRGVFVDRKEYKYAVNNDEPKSLRPLPDKFAISSFSCIALSDDFLAIGTRDKIMIFAASGEHAGRWLVCDETPKTGVTKLAFSNDGTQLVALVVVEDKDRYEAARIYSTAKFIPIPNQRENGDEVPLARPKLIKSVQSTAIRWERDYVHSPSGIAWSRKGDMIAICTTHSRAKAGIRILKKEVNTWRIWGIKEVMVHVADHREWHGLALTAISFFQNDECLALAVDSTNRDAADCYRIISERTHFKLERAQQIASGPNGTTNLAIAISQPFDAVALLNREGTIILLSTLTVGLLQVKPDGDVLGYLTKCQHVNPSRPHDPISMSFDKNGQKLLFLDHHGNLDIYQFAPGRLGAVKSLPYVPLIESRNI